MKLRNFLAQSMLIVSLLVLGGCSGHGNEVNATYNGDVYDPLEGYNRVMFSINDGLDTVLIRPAAIAYVTIIPEPLRDNLRNFLRNLKTPISLANELLQGDLEGAAHITKRFVVNTTVGFAGLADVAGHHGLPYEEEDFGQTLGVWGFSSGPYIVWPILGPSTLRDTGGLVVDSIADPFNIWMRADDSEEWIIARSLATGLVNRSALLDELDKLKAESLDYYAAIRSAYLMYRLEQIRDNAKSGGETLSAIPDYPDIPDYDDE